MLSGENYGRRVSGPCTPPDVPTTCLGVSGPDFSTPHRPLAPERYSEKLSVSLNTTDNCMEALMILTLLRVSYSSLDLEKPLFSW